MIRLILGAIFIKKILAKLANEFEKDLIEKCNKVNGDIVSSGLDNVLVEINRKMANTIFIDSHKNERLRRKQIYLLCKEFGVEKGMEVYFRRPLNFIKMGEILLG